MLVNKKRQDPLHILTEYHTRGCTKRIMLANKQGIAQLIEWFFRRFISIIRCMSVPVFILANRTYCNNRAVTGVVSVVRMTPGGRGNSQVTNQKVFISLSILQISNF